MIDRIGFPQGQLGLGPAFPNAALAAKIKAKTVVGRQIDLFVIIIAKVVPVANW